MLYPYSIVFYYLNFFLGVVKEKALPEKQDFQGILDSLDKISANANALKIWAMKNVKIKE